MFTCKVFVLIFQCLVLFSSTLSTLKNTRLLVGADKDKCFSKCLGFLKPILDLKWHDINIFFLLLLFFFLLMLHRAAGRGEDMDLCLKGILILAQHEFI